MAIQKTQNLLICSAEEFFLRILPFDWQNIRSLATNYRAQKNRVKFTRPSANFIFSCHNLKKIKYLKILRYKLSHLDEHKFKNNFQDTLNTLCKYACDIENIRCHRFSLKESLVSTKLLKLIKSIRGDYSQGTSNWQLRYTIKVTL